MDCKIDIFGLVLTRELLNKYFLDFITYEDSTYRDADGKYAVDLFYSLEEYGGIFIDTDEVDGDFFVGDADTETLKKIPFREQCIIIEVDKDNAVNELKELVGEYLPSDFDYDGHIAEFIGMEYPA